MNNNFPAGIRDNTRNTSMNLPVAIDYPAALALRQMALVQDELPKYRKSAPCSITCRIFTARCCWRRCGTPARALMKRSR